VKKTRPIKAIGRGRKRRAAGWTLLALGLLVAGVWVTSRWYLAAHCGITRAVTITTGELSIVSVTDPYPSHERGWAWRNREAMLAPVRWRWSAAEIRTPKLIHFSGYVLASYAEYDFGPAMLGTGIPRPPTATHAYLTFTLWPVPLLLWTPAALFLRSGILARRRANAGMCSKCGYSLAGLAADAVPRALNAEGKPSRCKRRHHPSAPELRSSAL
jgi:hypothetical protein